MIFYCLSNYRATQIREYLVFIGIFVFGLIFGLYPIVQVFFGDTYILPDEVNYFEAVDPNFWFRLVYFLYMNAPPLTTLFVVIYFSRSIWLEPPKTLKYIMGISIVVLLLMNSTVLLNSFLWFGISKYQAMLIRSWVSGIPFIIDGILALRLISELNSTPIDVKRMRRAAVLWKIAFIFTFLTSLSKFLRDLASTYSSNWDPAFNSLTTTIIYGFVSGAFLFVAIIVLFYPEAVLIFQVHIIRAKQLYKELNIQYPNVEGDYFNSIQKYLFEAIKKLETSGQIMKISEA